MKSIFLLSLLIVSIYAGNCGGNCPGNRCPSCPCGTTPHHIDIDAICRRHSWSQACCKCIIQHESGGNEHSMNYNTNGSFDVGVFQINKVNWACNGGAAPCDSESNLKCAIHVYQGSRNSWKPWSTARGCGCA